MTDHELFELSAGLEIRIEPLADGLPVALIDNVYARPDAVREAALDLDFGPPPDPYPGRLAAVPNVHASLNVFLARWLTFVNRDYLPMLRSAARIDSLTRVHCDFAIVDLHPDELGDHQRTPHTDPVPIFGLVYLNHEERGGTLFFRRSVQVAQSGPSPGYVTEDRDGFELAGRIEPRFNRLAIYPGFVPHSGDISGEWITSGERYSSPRLTQRLMFG